MKHPLLAGAARRSNQALLAHVKHLARQERESTASLIADLAEIDDRKLYAGEGYSSLFKYCIKVLRLSEDAAYNRIRAARLIRRFPSLLGNLASGELNVSTLGVLAPYLTDQNYKELRDAARNKSKREVEELVAERNPLPDVPASIRKLPQPSANVASLATRRPATVVAAGMRHAESGASAQSTSAAAMGSWIGEIPPASTVATRYESTSALGEDFSPSTQDSHRPVIAPGTSSQDSHRPVIAPLGGARYRMQFTVSADTYENFRRAQVLLALAVPDGDPAAIFDRALQILLAELRRTRRAQTSNPRPSRPARSGSRRIPADLVRTVYERDGDACAFPRPDGDRCNETRDLQVDHMRPVAAGGETTLENLRVLCRTHNLHAAAQYFGPDKIERSIARTNRKSKNRNSRRRQNEVLRDSLVRDSENPNRSPAARPPVPFRERIDSSRNSSRNSPKDLSRDSSRDSSKDSSTDVSIDSS